MLAVLIVVMVGAGAMGFASSPGAAAYPWPVTLAVCLVVSVVVSRPHAAIGGPRGSSVEATATGTVLLASMVLLPPLVLPVMLLRTVLFSAAPWQWRMWNTATHALSLGCATFAYWSINTDGGLEPPQRYLGAVAVAALLYYLIEQVAYTWLQRRLRGCSVSDTGLWSRDAVVLDALLLGAGAVMGAVVLVSAWWCVLAAVVLALVVQLLRALDRAQDGYLDAKTGLLQLPAFTRFATRAVASAERIGRPAAVLMIDLDHFRNLNTNHGHQAGDAILVEVAALLQRAVRAGDLVGRYGGEEFIVLLTETDDAGAHRVAERIRNAVAQIALPGARGEIRATASIGATSSWPGSEVTAMITAADDALYRAKSTGRNRTVVAVRAGAASG